MSRAPDPASAGDDASHGAARDQSRGQGGERFAAGRPLAAASAGPALAAALAGTRVGLSDDALAGFLGGCHKIAAWAAGMLMEGIAEYADRRPDDRFPHHRLGTRRITWAAGHESRDTPGQVSRLTCCTLMTC